MRRCSTVCETSDLVVSIGDVSADTVTDCCIPFNTNRGSNVALSPTVRTMEASSNNSKLAPPSTAILYRPGAMPTRL